MASNELFGALGGWCFSIPTPNIWGFSRAAGRNILGVDLPLTSLSGLFAHSRDFVTPLAS